MLDAVIIGGGTGGYVSAIRISQHGGNVVLVERDKMGGLCLNRGCIPTKFLVQNIRQLKGVQKNPVISGDVSIDYSKLVARKDQVTGMLCKGLEMLMGSHGVKIIKGTAIPQSPNVIRVLHPDGKEEKLETKNLIIATGSETKSVPGISPDGTRILTSDDILAMDSLPADLLILGGGYIGVEFASIFSSLGCRVTIVEELPDILQGIDHDLGKMIKALLIKGRVEVLTGASIRSVAQNEIGLNVQIETPAGMKEVNAEKMLLAAGRKAFIDSSFRVLGIDVDDNKIQVNSRMETTVPGIYAVGDVIGPPLLAHAAMAEAEVAADNLMGKERVMDYSKIPSCIFTTPEAASVGMAEQDAARDHEIKIGKFQFRNSSRAILSNDIEGFIKIIVNEAGRTLLGVHIIGPNAAELIAAASVLLKSKGTVEDLAEAVQAHPTLAESLTEAALDVDGLGIHIPKMP